MLKGDFKSQTEEEQKPRRYEVRDAETGEKLSGVSFILTPTGEEMHLLTKPGVWVGPMKDIGIYYHGELHNGPSGNKSLPVVRTLALEYMAERIIEQLASLGDERDRYGHMCRIQKLSEYAARKWEEYREENAEEVAEHERKQQEWRERYRKLVRGQTENG